MFMENVDGDHYFLTKHDRTETVQFLSVDRSGYFYTD